MDILKQFQEKINALWKLLAGFLSRSDLSWCKQQL